MIKRANESGKNLGDFFPKMSEFLPRIDPEFDQTGLVVAQNCPLAEKGNAKVRLRNNRRRSFQTLRVAVCLRNPMLVE